MTYTKASSRSMEDIEQRLKDAAQKHKFGVLHMLDIQQTLKSKGIDFGRECRVYDVCNPKAASTALEHDMRAAAVLPCRIAVYQSDAGAIIATVNPTELMRATGITGIESMADEIQREVIAIIDEAA